MLSVILNIFIELIAKEQVTVRQLAERYEKSTRQVQRYLDKMRDAGVPIESVRGRGGGIKLANTAALQRLYFTDTEIDEIITAAQLCLPPQKAYNIIFKMKALQKKKSK